MKPRGMAQAAESLFAGSEAGDAVRPEAHAFLRRIRRARSFACVGIAFAATSVPASVRLQDDAVGIPESPAALCYEQLQAIRKRPSTINDYKIETTKVGKRGKLRRAITTYYRDENGLRRFRRETAGEDQAAHPSAIMIFDGAGCWFLIGEIAIKMPGDFEGGGMDAEQRPGDSINEESPVSAVRPSAFSAIRDRRDGRSVIRVHQSRTDREREQLLKRAQEVFKRFAGVDFDSLPRSRKREAQAALERSIPSRSEEVIDEETGIVLEERTFDRAGKLLKNDENASSKRTNLTRLHSSRCPRARRRSSRRTLRNLGKCSGTIRTISSAKPSKSAKPIDARWRWCARAAECAALRACPWNC